MRQTYAQPRSNEYLTDCRAADATYPHRDVGPDRGGARAAPAAQTAVGANRRN